MLQKDGENITKNIQSKFKEDFKFINKKTKTVTFKLVNSVYNGKDKTPRSYHIETSYISSDANNGDTSEYIYYKNSRQKMVGGLPQQIFTPEFISFSQRGDFSINLGENGKDNLDLLAFFLNHPRLAKSKSGDGIKRALFYLEDKNKEAIDKVVFKQDKAKMDYYLYNEETRLDDDKLKTIALSLRVSGVEDMNIQRIQTSIEDRCKKNPSLFLRMAEVNDVVIMRANIQKGVDQGFLSLDLSKNRWVLTNKDSGDSSNLATVRKLEDPTDALVYWFNNTDNSDSYGKLVEFLTGKPTKRTSKAEEVKNSEPSELEIKLKLAEAENEKLRLQKEKAEAELEKAKLLSGDKKKKKAVS